MKRVLLTTFPDAFLHQGGGEREIHLLSQALNANGVIAEIYGPASRPVASYDAVVHFSMLGGCEPIIDGVAQAGIPMILWPNLWFVSEPSSDHIVHLSRMLRRFQAVIFRSDAEETHFRRWLDLSGKSIVRVAPLISPRFFQRNVADTFPESFGLHDYAIWPGIIEPQKNQIAAVRAFRSLEIDLVISGWVRDARYAELCRIEAGPNIHFMPALQFGSELHVSALACSRLFVELPLDFPGTSALEAAALGCRILVPPSDWASEMLPGAATVMPPCGAEQIRESALAALRGDNSAPAHEHLVEMNQAVEPLVKFLRGF